MSYLLAGDMIAVIINNLGGTSYLELNIVAKEIIELCRKLVAFILLSFGVYFWVS